MPFFVFPSATSGVVTDRKLLAAAADEGGGRSAPVEGARPEMQGDPVGTESLQPLCHWQMPDRWGLVSHRQAAWTAECAERGRGETTDEQKHRAVKSTDEQIA